jgi:hypothetical protein
MAHRSPSVRLVICLEEEIICKIKKNEEVTEDILRLLKKIKVLIETDIALDRQILEKLGEILTLLQTIDANVNSILQILQSLIPIINSINTNVSTILAIVRGINTNVNTLTSLACKPISSVPFTITQPGCYKVINELAFSGPGNAITITTRDVIIDGGDFSLTLTGSTAVGINSDSHANIIIRNITVTSSSTDPAINTANRGIIMSNTDNLLLERVHTSFTNRGVTLSNTANVIIRDCLFDRHLAVLPAASIGLFFLNNISNALIKDSKFYNTNTLEDAGRGLYIQGSSTGAADNVKVQDCQFSNSLFLVLNFNTIRVIQNVVLENCVFNITDGSYQGWSVLFVSEVGNLAIQNITIRNVTISNPNSSLFYEPILLVGVSGGMISGCDITSTSVGNFVDRGIINVALIHLGYTITSILDTEDIPDAQVENITIYNCNLSGGNSLQNNHQNVGIYIEAFTANVTIDKVNISQTGAGQVAPPTVQPLRKKPLKLMTLEGEEEFIRSKPEINKNQAKLEKILSRVKEAPLLKAPPSIPDQRAAAILVDGGQNILIKDSVISDAGAGAPGTLPGHGIVFSGLLQFQTVPALQPPVLTITTILTNASKVINTTVFNSQGNGIEDDGAANSIEKCNVKDNVLTGILLNGFTGFVEDNNVLTNSTNGIVNGGGGYAILNNNAALNLPFNYVNVPAVVHQGDVCVAGQNVQVP